MTIITTLEGDLRSDGSERFAIVASRFNHFIVDRLVEGAVDSLVRHGVPAANLVLAKTPGAWELPIAVKRFVDSGKFDAVIVLSDTIEQAIERAGTKAGNKGADAAVAALEMVRLGRAFSAAGY